MVDLKKSLRSDSRDILVLPKLHTYSVQKSAKQPLRDFLLKGLESAGCKIIFASQANFAPFVISIETKTSERLGIVAYAFLANKTPTKNRPSDERSFQIKYSDKSEYRSANSHQIWQDDFGLFTTLFLGIDLEEDFFVAADPMLHNPTKFFIRLEFKDRHAEEIKKNGWCAWKRERRETRRQPDDFEALVGGNRDRVLDLVRFERSMKGSSQTDRLRAAQR
jgi:hypothetical protein